MSSKKIFIGFDGFVDRIMKPVLRGRGGKKEYCRTLPDFCSFLKEKGETSFVVDMELVEERAGGNMPNMAKAMSELGYLVTGVGALGYPSLHSVFRHLEKQCTLYSVCDPGLCDAVEFDGSKMMMSINSEIDRLDARMLLHRFPAVRLIHELEECDGAAFLNWGELKGSPSIWKLLAEEILPACRFKEQKLLLIDFSDFSRKTGWQIRQMMEYLNAFSRYFRITVSMNEHELMLFGKQIKTEQSDECRLILELTSILPCEYIVVHGLRETIYTEEGKVRTLEKEICTHSIAVTGGGDHFNAGLLGALTDGLSIEEAVILGNTAVNTFVGTGSIATL